MEMLITLHNKNNSHYILYSFTNTSVTFKFYLFNCIYIFLIYYFIIWFFFLIGLTLL